MRAGGRAGSRCTPVKKTGLLYSATTHHKIEFLGDFQIRVAQVCVHCLSYLGHFVPWSASCVLWEKLWLIQLLFMFHLHLQEMNLLVEADQPGNQLDDYISRLNAILSQKATGILQLQNRLAHFQKRLKERNVLVSTSGYWFHLEGHILVNSTGYCFKNIIARLVARQWGNAFFFFFFQVEHYLIWHLMLAVCWTIHESTCIFGCRFPLTKDQFLFHSILFATQFFPHKQAIDELFVFIRQLACYCKDLKHCNLINWLTSSCWTVWCLFSRDRFHKSKPV